MTQQTQQLVDQQSVNLSEGNLLIQCSDMNHVNELAASIDAVVDSLNEYRFSKIMLVLDGQPVFSKSVD